MQDKDRKSKNKHPKAGFFQEKERGHVIAGFKNDINIIEKENVEREESEFISIANIGASVFLVSSKETLFTGHLSSCYAIILVGEKKNGTKVAALNHWLGEDVLAKDVISYLKKRLIKLGVKKNSVECLAIGGDEQFPDQKNEIQNLLDKGIVDYVIPDLCKKPGDYTNLMLRVNDKNEVMIEYSVKNFSHQYLMK